MAVKVRLLYEKTDKMRFVGHLDLLKLFQRALKRAAIPVTYSQGFNPHQDVAFALPLPLGMPGLGECVDITLTEMPAADICPVLDETLPKGLKILAARVLTEGEKNAASLICAASYEMVFPNEQTARACTGLMQETAVHVMKQTKTKTRQADIRPDILAMEQDGCTVYATLAAGSARNLKPSLIVAHICGTSQKTQAQITRMALFKSEKNELTALF